MGTLDPRGEETWLDGIESGSGLTSPRRGWRVGDGGVLYVDREEARDGGQTEEEHGRYTDLL